MERTTATLGLYETTRYVLLRNVRVSCRIIGVNAPEFFSKFYLTVIFLVKKLKTRALELFGTMGLQIHRMKERDV